MTPEGKLKLEVTKFLASSGLIYLRLNSGIVKVRGGFMHLCPEGTADFIVCCPDPRWIELKAPGQKTLKTRAEKQQAFADKVMGLGHRHIQATSLDQVIEFVAKEVL